MKIFQVFHPAPIFVNENPALALIFVNGNLVLFLFSVNGNMASAIISVNENLALALFFVNRILAVAVLSVIQNILNRLESGKKEMENPKQLFHCLLEQF